MIRRLSYFTILAAILAVLFSCATEPEGRPKGHQDAPADPVAPQTRPETERAEPERPGKAGPAQPEGETDRSSPPELPLPEVGEPPEEHGAGNDTPVAAPPRQPRPQPPPEPTPEERLEHQIERIIASMSVEERIGQLIFPAIMKDPSGRPIWRVTEDVRALMKDVRPGGVILFGPNFTTLEATRAFLDELQSLAEIPLVFAVDQEGGLVSRLTESSSLPATPIPPASLVGATGSEELARELGSVVGAELRSLGIVMNLAPVADVNTNPENPVIRSRAYGSDPVAVARIVAAVVEGMQSQGVAAVLKHFPGHGDTYDDTHYSSAVVYHDLQRLREVELVPFRLGIEAGAKGVMTGHIGVPEILGHEEPATFSQELLEGVLRQELGFDGLVVTDSLAMAALINYYPQDEIVFRALEAGNDILLRPLYARRAYDALQRGLASGRITEERIDASVGRILRFKFESGLMELPEEGEEFFGIGEVGGNEAEVLGREEHWEVIRRIEAAAAPF